MTRGPVDRFYPIVPDAAWVRRLLPLGVRTVQLRSKGLPAVQLSAEIAEAVALARRHNCHLVINDHWREAIEAGATSVHLGQEDLAAADRPALRRAGIRLGISTHSDDELEVALTAEPDYVALGPIYETKLKVMPWKPQGLERVAAWKRRIGGLQLVAIGGITLDRAADVVAAGADSVAVITDFLSHPDPDRRVAEWVSWARGDQEDVKV